MALRFAIFVIGIGLSVVASDALGLFGLLAGAALTAYIVFRSAGHG